MIIPDTSIWIEFLRREEPVFSELRSFLERGDVMGLAWIFGELLQGARDTQEVSVILGFWESVNHIPAPDLNSIWIEAGTLSHKGKLFSKGIGLIDCAILAASRKTKAKLWTLDQKLLRTIPAELRYE